MKRRFVRFNIYLLLPVLLAVCSCNSYPFKEPELSTIRLHLEVNPDGSPRNGPVPIYRASPVYVNVETTHFLDEAYVRSASVVEALGGFELRIEFNDHGAKVLEQYSTAFKGKRIAIYSHWGTSLRWLGAPVMANRITNGILQFTPDANREEADRIVFGLSNVAAREN